MKILLSILIIYLSLFMPEPTHIATPTHFPYYPEQKYEYYDTASGVDWTINTLSAGTGQIFTVGTTGDNEDYKVTKIKVFLNKVGSPGDITVYLYENTAPVGSIIGTGTIAEADIPIDDWVECVISSSKILVQDGQYAFGMVCPGADAENYVNVSLSDGGYGGDSGIAGNDGEWYLGIPDGILFEIWGKKAKIQTVVPIHIGEPTR